MGLTCAEADSAERTVQPSQKLRNPPVGSRRFELNVKSEELKAAEEAMISDLDENNPGTEWERVARLCDFNPKSSKQAKDVSRMRSVLISLKQSPLVR
uniref:Clathrin light chain n=1 Tax=Poecilia latipinna TaxID=48699 RepID=A0A3B3TWW4_9TELE